MIRQFSPKTPSICDDNGRIHRKIGSNRSRKLPLPTCVDEEWSKSICSDNDQRHTISHMLSSGRRCSIHPSAYIVKALAVSLKMRAVLIEDQDKFDALGDELYRLSNLIRKRPRHPACKIWHRQSLSKLSESKNLMESMKLINEFILMDIVNNFELLSARVCSELFSCSSSTSNSINTSNGEDFMGERILVHKKNIELTKTLRARVEEANDATKNTIRDNYECCSGCETMYNKSLLSFFGIVQENSTDLSSTFGSFVCFECNDSKEKTHTEALTQPISVGKKKARKKKKGNKTQLQRSTATINSCVNLDKMDDPPKSPTSIISLHVLESPVGRSKGLPKVSAKCIVQSDPRNLASHNIDDSKSTEVPNHDFVDYLLQCGSILALDKYMNELGLDCPGDGFGKGREIDNIIAM